MKYLHDKLWAEKNTHENKIEKMTERFKNEIRELQASFKKVEDQYKQKLSLSEKVEVGVFGEEMGEDNCLAVQKNDGKGGMGDVDYQKIQKILDISKIFQKSFYINSTHCLRKISNFSKSKVKIQKNKLAATKTLVRLFSRNTSQNRRSFFNNLKSLDLISGVNESFMNESFLPDCSSILKNLDNKFHKKIYAEKCCQEGYSFEMMLKPKTKSVYCETSKSSSTTKASKYCQVSKKSHNKYSSCVPNILDETHQTEFLGISTSTQSVPRMRNFGTIVERTAHEIFISSKNMQTSNISTKNFSSNAYPDVLHKTNSCVSRMKDKSIGVNKISSVMDKSSERKKVFKSPVRSKISKTFYLRSRQNSSNRIKDRSVRASPNTTNTNILISDISQELNKTTSKSAKTGKKDKGVDKPIWFNPIKQTQCNPHCFTENRRIMTDLSSQKITKLQKNQKPKKKKKSQYIQTFKQNNIDKEIQVEMEINQKVMGLVSPLKDKMGVQRLICSPDSVPRSEISLTERLAEELDSMKKGNILPDNDRKMEEEQLESNFTIDQSFSRNAEGSPIFDFSEIQQRLDVSNSYFDMKIKPCMVDKVASTSPTELKHAKVQISAEVSTKDTQFDQKIFDNYVKEAKFRKLMCSKFSSSVPITKTRSTLTVIVKGEEETRDFSCMKEFFEEENLDLIVENKQEQIDEVKEDFDSLFEKKLEESLLRASVDDDGNQIQDMLTSFKANGVTTGNFTPQTYSRPYTNVVNLDIEVADNRIFSYEKGFERVRRFFDKKMTEKLQMSFSFKGIAEPMKGVMINQFQGFDTLSRLFKSRRNVNFSEFFSNLKINFVEVERDFETQRNLLISLKKIFDKNLKSYFQVLNYKSALEMAEDHIVIDQKRQSLTILAKFCERQEERTSQIAFSGIKLCAYSSNFEDLKHKTDTMIKEKELVIKTAINQIYKLNCKSGIKSIEILFQKKLFLTKSHVMKLLKPRSDGQEALARALKYLFSSKAKQNKMMAMKNMKDKWRNTKYVRERRKVDFQMGVLQRIKMSKNIRKMVILLSKIELNYSFNDILDYCCEFDGY